MTFHPISVFCFGNQANHTGREQANENGLKPFLGTKDNEEKHLEIVDIMKP